MPLVQKIFDPGSQLPVSGPIRSLSRDLHAAQKVRHVVRLADLNTIGAKDVVGGNKVEVEIGNHEVVNVFVRRKFSVSAAAKLESLD